MANPEHLAILKRGVIEWNEWRRAQRPKTRLPIIPRKDFRLGPDLTGADLCGAQLSEAYLVGVCLRSANLRGANLELANLRGAELEHADLQRANCKWADISQAQLSSADLRSCRLPGADLRMSDFDGAKLGRAKLDGADLRGTRVTNADLRGANLAGARLLSTVFGNTNLRGCRGLEFCEHQGPSVIDYHTLRRSGRLPREFLLGCGISDVFIQILPQALAKPQRLKSSFISYSHVDKEFAGKLYEALHDASANCWWDAKRLMPGQDVPETLEQAIRQVDAVLLCCSRNSLNDRWWVDNEIGIAFDREQQMHHEVGRTRLVIPIDIDGYLRGDEWQNGYKSQIRRRKAADFTAWETDDGFQAGMERLLKALRR